MRGLFKLLSDQRGLGTIEYALVASLISIAAFAAMTNLGTKVDQHYSGINTAVTTAK